MADTTWLPFPTNASTHAADVQEADPDSILHLYRRLLDLRRTHPALRRGTMELAPLDGTLLRYRRVDGDDALTVVVNVGDAPIDWPADADATVLVRTASVDAGRLGADEAAVIAG